MHLKIAVTLLDARPFLTLWGAPHTECHSDHHDKLCVFVRVILAFASLKILSVWFFFCYASQATLQNK